MNNYENLLGRAEALLDRANDTESLKSVLRALLSAMKDMNEEIRSLKDDAEELNDYVNRMDEDLTELEMLHSEDLDDKPFAPGEEDEDAFEEEEEYDFDEDEEPDEKPEGEKEELPAKEVFKRVLTIWNGDKDE